jgi:prepilin-type N-terminal cleavage/methylation domain-containing protein
MGFTLIEMLVVLSLLMVCFSLGLFVSFSDERHTRFRSERQVVISALLKARSQAIADMCYRPDCERGGAHGVFFGEPGIYSIFEGTSFSMRFEDVDERIQARVDSSIEGCLEVVFSPGSGEAVCPPGSSIHIVSRTGEDSEIIVDSSGRISWND